MDLEQERLAVLSAEIEQKIAALEAQLDAYRTELAAIQPAPPAPKRTRKP